MSLQHQNTSLKTKSSNYVAGVINYLGSEDKEVRNRASIELVTIANHLTVDKAMSSQSISGFILLGNENRVDGKMYAIEIVRRFINWMQDTINVTNKMSTVQVEQCAIMISKEYRHLTFEDLLIVFRKIITGKFGTLYNRLDMAIVCECLNKYTTSDEYVYAQEKYATSYKKKEEEQSDEYYEALRDKYLPKIVEMFQIKSEDIKSTTFKSGDSFSKWIERVKKEATNDEITELMHQCKIRGEVGTVNVLKEILKNRNDGNRNL